MSQEKIGGGNILNLNERLTRLKATRGNRPKSETQQEAVPPLTSEQALIEARIMAAKFSSFKSLAEDIDRQQIKLGQIPNASNYERARSDYLNELRQARRLETDELEGALKIMFAGYNEEQTVFLNSKYVAYARAYLEKVDNGHKLPEME